MGTWRAEDSAGNVELHTQSVIIMDTSAPEFQEQSYDDAVYECDSFPDKPLVEPICWDGCAAATVNYVDPPVETDSDVYTCGTTVTHEYECVDECGRVDTSYVTTISHDTSPPDLVDDDDLCIFPAYGQDWGFYAVYDLDGLLAAIDNCGDDGTDYFQGPYICNATDFTVNGDPVSFNSVGGGDMIVECQVLLGKLYVKVDRTILLCQLILGVRIIFMRHLMMTVGIRKQFKETYTLPLMLIVMSIGNHVILVIPVSKIPSLRSNHNLSFISTTQLVLV